MAAPIIPILKKLAVSIVSDKKLLKRVLGIVLAIIIVAMIPGLVVVAIFTQMGNIDASELNSFITTILST